MIVRLSCAALMMISPCFFASTAFAQDIPGIEICTVEKTMERRTSCLQSNIDFLQKSMSKLTADYQQKLEAANRQIETLKAAAASMQKRFDDIQVGQRQMAEELKKKADALAVKDGMPAPTTKEGVR